jgi:hypothetical protein
MGRVEEIYLLMNAYSQIKYEMHKYKGDEE